MTLTEQHWRAPALEEDTEQEEVCLRLPTISLFPPEVIAEMEQRFPKRLARLDETSRLAIATAILEGRVTNERLQELTDKHPRDITFLLKNLVFANFLVGNNKRRWSSYTLAPAGPASGLVDSQHNEQGSQHKEASSQHNGQSSQHKEPGLAHNEASLPQKDALPALVEEIRNKKRSAPAKVEAAILALCADAFVPAQELADTLQRGVETLKNHYISKMIRDGRLEARYPDQPTHPNQAYRARMDGR